MNSLIDDDVTPAMKTTPAKSAPPIPPRLRWGLSCAQGYFELGMLPHAEHELSRLGSEFENHPEVIGLRLRVLLARRSWPQVVETARHGVRLFPEVPEFYVHGAAAYDMLGQRELGRRLWQSAPESVRSSGVLHMHVARFEASLGNVDSAREHLHHALSLEPALRATVGNDPRLAKLLGDAMVN